MKKLLFSVSLSVAALFASAQKFSKVETPYLLNKFEEAKAEIDKIAADSKSQSNPEFWFWHATVYAKIFEDTNLYRKYPTAGDIAYNSFKKYEQMQPDFKHMNESAIPGMNVVNTLYNRNWTVGYSGFYENKKYDSAFKYLSRGTEISEMISKNKWADKKILLDTLLILFSGYAAENAKMPQESIKYMSKIADMNVVTVPYVGEVKQIYYILLENFKTAKDYESFSKYLKIASNLFPASKDDWEYMETQYIEDNMTLAEKEQTYDKADAAGTLTANQYLSFGNMFYNLKQEDREKMDSATLANYRKKAEGAFAKGYEKDQSNGLVAYNVGLINYNDWVDLDDAYSANIKRMGELNRSKTAEKDPKKKAANEARIKKEIDAIKALNAGIEKRQHAFAEKAADWFEKSFKVLSVKAEPDRAEKQVLGKSVDNLANLYLWKRDKSKGNNADYDKYDALYKKYDALHDKY